MDDPNFKNKYDKYKYCVKKWEKDFKIKFNRIPSKYDIRDAPRKIRDSYKMYYKLKTSLLENTLSDVLFDDGFDVFEFDNSQMECDPNFLDPNSSSTSLNLPSNISLLTDCSITMNNDNETEASSSVLNSVTNCANVNENYLSKEFEAVEELKLNKNAWQNNKLTMHNEVQISKTSKTKDPKMSATLKVNLREKLFSSTGSFSKRNPRKSLSKNSLTGFTKKIETNNVQEKEILPDLETILLQKSKEISQINVNTSTAKIVSRNLDVKWLNRLQNDQEDCNLMSSSFIGSDLSKNEYNITQNKYGLQNIKIPESKKIEEKISKLPENSYNSSDEMIPNSEDEDHQLSQYSQHVRKRRKIAQDSEKNVSDSKRINDDIVPQNKNNIHDDLKELQSNSEIQKESVTNLNKLDSEIDRSIQKKQLKARKVKSVACKKYSSSDKEDPDYKSSTKKIIEKKNKPKKDKKKTTKSTNSKKVKSNLEEEKEYVNPEDLKYELALEVGNISSTPRINQIELEQAENALKNYLNVDSRMVSKQREKKIDEKIITARSKLEDKMAKGKLNENFIALNLRKKIFVRGKKTINFSKYKKKLWRDKKKIAALSGPDMDMRGCDGGDLICFSCGKSGHFAQQCKIKSDNLMPLEANNCTEEDSSFPTLEEAEQAAKQGAIISHSRNINALPKASNYLLIDSNFQNEKNTINEDEEDADTQFQIERAFDDDFNFDEEAEKEAIKNSTNFQPQYINSKVPEEFLKKAGLLEKNHGNITPIYSLDADGSIPQPTPEVLETLKLFGHKNFRKNQDKAIMRVLCGLSTLVTLSTGSGKSLCYQLPAYIYSRKKKCLTLVISPLVSLMEDQVHGVPGFLRAHCLHTNQTPQQKNKVMDLVGKGEIDILLVSPEAIVAGERSTGFGSILRNLPPIAFACIDEAHCVSHWSHNFRPSYLMICRVLKEKLGVKTILGLTATATLLTRKSIIRHLEIKDAMFGVISDTPIPDNLILSVSKDVERDRALIQLLRSERFDYCQSVIIYCTRRDECERIATYLRTCMQDKPVGTNDGSKKKRKRVNWHAEPYHAGLPSSRRRTIQNAFMSNDLRIVVATIAFGMGINKADIRAIIHYNMPKNFESYVQEIGRAGRDGKIAHCHLFLDSKGTDLFELKRHIYANSIDRHLIRKLLQNVFIKCSCKNLSQSSSSSTSVSNSKRICCGHEIGFSIEETIRVLDIPQENIATLLCYLELEDRYDVTVLANAYTVCKVLSYGGAKILKQAAKECPPLAMAIALALKAGTFDGEKNVLEFSVIQIASAIGWSSGVVKYQLKNLEWISVNGYPKRTSISVSFQDLGFRIKAPGDFTSDEIDEALDLLNERTNLQEKNQLVQLQYIYDGLTDVAFKNCVHCCKENFETEASDKLKNFIRIYFQNDCLKDTELRELDDDTPDEVINNNVRTMLNIYPENNFTGRSLARIFHGVSSPNFPAVIWGRCKYWREHCKSDFHRIVKLANNVIVRLRTQC